MRIWYRADFTGSDKNDEIPLDPPVWNSSKRPRFRFLFTPKGKLGMIEVSLIEDDVCKVLYEGPQAYAYDVEVTVNGKQMVSLFVNNELIGIDLLELPPDTALTPTVTPECTVVMHSIVASQEAE